MAKTKHKILLGATIKGLPDELQQISTFLRKMGYEVLRSPLLEPVSNPDLHQSLALIDECDLFLGIVRPYFGKMEEDKHNIALEEVQKVITSKKPYWFMVHRDVVFARFLMQKVVISQGKAEERKGMDVKLRSNSIFDTRAIEIYNTVIKDGIPIVQRNGNWAQQFYHSSEMLVYIKAQFSDRQFIDQVVKG